MRIHLLQHESFESPAHIERWATRRQAVVTATHFYQPGWQLPDAGALDLLVVMGGPMGVHDDAIYPWLADEKHFIHACIKAGKKVLGVCLGAQLAAHVLGARVTKNAHKEIGWFDIAKTSIDHPVFAVLPEKATMFHWHGDTFDIPEDAIHLASSEACHNQAFIWNEQVLGLQFHAEVGMEHVRDFIAHGEAELREGGPYVQAAQQMLAAVSQVEAMEMMLYAMLDEFVR